MLPSSKVSSVNARLPTVTKTSSNYAGRKLTPSSFKFLGPPRLSTPKTMRKHVRKKLVLSPLSSNLQKSIVTKKPNVNISLHKSKNEQENDETSTAEDSNSTTNTTTSSDSSSSSRDTEDEDSPFDVSKQSINEDDDVSISTDVSLPNLVKNTSVPAIRLSYFAHIPPYIHFSGYNEKSEQLPVNVRKHLKWKLNSLTPSLVRKTVENSGFRLLNKGTQFLGQWAKHTSASDYRASIRQHQKSNHFPGTMHLGRKDLLSRNMNKMMLKFGTKNFGFLPKSYILPTDLKQLKQDFSRKSKEKLWIVKPAGGARGLGVRVISKWQQIPQKKSFIVQKYIAKPLLINDRKFDLRIYVLVTSFHPLRVYMYNNGLVRFASMKYSNNLEDTDRFIHLTNYSLNKNCEMYSKNEDAHGYSGHKWTLKTFFRYLSEKQNGAEKIPVIMKQIKDIIIKTLIAAEEPISANLFHLWSRYNSYELFGFDILLDENYKAWLLEVNISPSLHSSSPVDVAVKGPLIKEVFNIVGYHLPPSMPKRSRKDFLERLDKTVECPATFDKQIYSTIITKEEKTKQQEFRSKFWNRNDYIVEILDFLTSDDICYLASAEDELSQCKNFQRIFPTSKTHSYFQYFTEPRYYNMLMDAWEETYETNRLLGVQRLKELCANKYHLTDRIYKDNECIIQTQTKINSTVEEQDILLEKAIEKVKKESVGDSTFQDQLNREKQHKPKSTLSKQGFEMNNNNNNSMIISNDTTYYTNVAAVKMERLVQPMTKTSLPKFQPLSISKIYLNKCSSNNRNSPNNFAKYNFNTSNNNINPKFTTLNSHNIMDTHLIPNTFNFRHNNLSTYYVPKPYSNREQ